MEQSEQREQSAGALPGCEDKRSREVYALEGDCPYCGVELEFFSDELEKRQTLRCFQCKGSFTPDDYRRSIRN